MKRAGAGAGELGVSLWENGHGCSGNAWWRPEDSEGLPGRGQGQRHEGKRRPGACEVSQELSGTMTAAAETGGKAGGGRAPGWSTLRREAAALAQPTDSKGRRGMERQEPTGRGGEVRS